ncbi:MAG: branched-chain amino acid transaminase [Ectothiorhodospiraceae bacterium]
MSMADRDGYIWMDGEFVPWREANVHVLTHSLHYGLAAFEGIRAYNTVDGTAVFRLPEHIRRFFDSAKILGMHLPFSQEQIREACLETVKRNELKSAYLRPLAYYGSEGMGVRADNLSSHVMVAAWEWGAYLGAESMDRGIRVKTSSFTRHHVNVTMCRAKVTGHYVNSILAVQEAVACGYDEALLLDVEGFVAEGSGENFFIVRDGVVHTPELASALSGVTRDAVLTLARDAGIPVVERRITRDEVYTADEAFFTGTAAEVTPVRELDDRVIGDGKRGPVTAELQKLFFDQVEGRRDAHPTWLTHVR